ncbi:DNRLRE domain-containing protein [Brevibacillus reuszeri]|uniref:DNRLRE domain-containing protein n=1 Tax=Brevibacillus reuszeri TaxID=54915 RepID=UPI00366BB251
MPTLQTIIGELPHKRTSNSKHYLMSDGSYQAIIFSGDVHYEDENGNLQNIDTDLYDEADFDVMEFPVSRHKCDAFKARRQIVEGAKGKGVLDRDRFDFHALRVPFAATISRNFRKGYSIGKGENKLTFKPIGASVSVGRLNEEKRNEVEYQDAWNDVDVKLEMTDRGIKETLILKTEKAPTTFSFQVEGNLADDFSAGDLLLENAWLEDSNGERRDVEQIVRRENTKVYIDIIADVTGLVFPVLVDPSVISNVQVSSDSYIFQNTPTQNYGTNAALKIGGSTGFQNLIFMNFTLPSIPTNASIKNADLFLYCYDSAGAATPLRIVSWAVGSPWVESTITWDNAPKNMITVTPSTYVDGTNGWKTFGISSIVQGWVDGSLQKYGIRMNEFDSNSGVLYFRSKENTVVAERPYLTINYNVPPTAPTITVPNGGETWNATETIRWQAATDSDGDSLRYHIQLTTDGGSTWKDIIALTTYGATSYSYNFINEPETSVAKIRIRAYDGTAYGPWDESDGVFTILHNVAPEAPTNLSPSGGAPIDRTSAKVFTWKHNDPNSNDPQSKFDLQWRQVGASTWNTVTQTTPNQYWNAPANTFPRGNIEWQVRTYDQAGLSGPYSNQATFFAGEKPADPTIIGPSSPVPVARPTLEWSSYGQTGYQVQVLNAARNTLWDSGEVSSLNKARTIGIDLTNNTSYFLRVRIKNTDGLWSGWVERSITVSYTTPPTPILTITGKAQEGKMMISIQNPNPSGTEPNVTSNDLYRRELGQEEWTRIKVGIPRNGSYEDFTVASGITYEYKVRAFGNNATMKDTHYYQGTVHLNGVWLHCVGDPSGTTRQFVLRSGYSDEWKAEGSLMQFAGRKRPVAEFGEGGEGNIQVDLSMLKDSEDRISLQRIVSKRSTVCYRDNRGRKMFGVIFVLPSTDTYYGYDVSLSIDETDYREEV